MSEQTEWEYCRCEADAEAESDRSCGCGNEHNESNAQDNAQLIHWREQHWHWRCAFQALLEENDDMRRRLVKLAVDKVFQRRRNLLQDFDRIDDK